MLNITVSKKRCPFLNEPREDCYCAKMNSQDIERVIYLCTDNFEVCDIYKNGNGNGSSEKTERRRVNAKFRDIVITRKDKAQ